MNGEISIDRVSLVRRDKVKTLPIGKLLFSFKGRIGRAQFLSWYLGIATVLFVVAFYIDVEFAGYLNIAALWSQFALTTKRYLDYGSAGWLDLFQLLPGIGVLIILFGCGFTNGNFNDNKYGFSIYRK
jgi:uncharacterized membrane protein YhaH (DUF805 family)